MLYSVRAAPDGWASSLLDDWGSWLPSGCWTWWLCPWSWIAVPYAEHWVMLYLVRTAPDGWASWLVCDDWGSSLPSECWSSCLGPLLLPISWITSYSGLPLSCDMGVAATSTAEVDAWPPWGLALSMFIRSESLQNQQQRHLTLWPF